MAGRIKDRFAGDDRTHDQVRQVTRPAAIDPHKSAFSLQRGDAPVDRAPSADDAFKPTRLPEFDFFDRLED